MSRRSAVVVREWALLMDSSVAGEVGQAVEAWVVDQYHRNGYPTPPALRAVIEAIAEVVVGGDMPEILDAMDAIQDSCSDPLVTTCSDEGQMVSVKNAAQQLGGVSEGLVCRWLRAGRLRGRHVNPRLWEVEQSSIDAMVARRARRAA